VKRRSPTGDLARWLAAKLGIPLEAAERSLVELAQVRVRLAAETDARDP